MITVYIIAVLVAAIAWLTHDSDGLDYHARDVHRAMSDRDHRAGPSGVLVP